MEVLKCVQCKGEIALNDNGLTGKCLSCGSVYYYKTEKSARIVSLLNQANISRLRGDYDGAILAYQIAIKEDETDADAYWGIALSTFGIEYIEDPRTNQFIPTCRRTIVHSILNDANYENAIKYASPEQAQEFERQAKEIDQLQQNIKQKIKDEQDFDVFLCFKSTDSEGNATEDRFIAKNIYNELEKKNIRTFFSEVSLKDRLGQDYEPIIYKALYTCKVFILIATKEEYIQSPWVKNEWSRFRDRASDEGLENCAFAVFKNLKESQLPPIFRSQGADLAKYPAGGYEIEIADNLETRFNQKKFSNFDSKYRSMFREESSIVLEEKVVDLLEKKLSKSRLTFDEKIDRVLAYDEIGNHSRALAIIDEIIDEYPRRAKAWFCKAKLITYNFTIDVVDLYLDSNLKTEYFFNMENAMRFASAEEAQVFEHESKEFKQNLETLNLIDQKAEILEESLYDYITCQSKLLNQENEINEELKKSKENLVKVLADSEIKKKALKRNLANKNYYIKNIPTTPNVVYSLFNFLGLIVILSAIVGGLVNLKNIVQYGVGSYAKLIFEFAILCLVGILPFVMTAFLRKQEKFKKVKAVIENDKNKLDLLQKEISQAKAQIAAFDKEKMQTTLKQENLLQQHNQQKSKAAEQIKDAYLTVRGLFDKEFVKKYVKKYEEFSYNALNEKIFQNNAEFNLLKEEKQNIIKSNEKHKKELTKKRPNYFSENYEKYSEKVGELFEKNQQRIEYVDSRLKEIQIENQIFELQKQKTFSNDNFFENFLMENNPKPEGDNTRTTDEDVQVTKSKTEENTKEDKRK